MRSWRLWLGVAVTLSCLALALAGIDWRAVRVTLRQADWFFFVPAAAMLIAFLLARSVRWRLLLGPSVSLSDAFAITNIGYLVSNVLPFRMGDPARAVAIGLTGKGKASAALSTVIVERVLDVLAVIMILAATAPFVSQAGWIHRAGAVVGAAAVTVLALLMVVARRPEWGRGAVRASLARLPHVDVERWMSGTDGLLEGLAALRSGRATVALLAWSGITWACSVGCYLALLRAFVARPTVIEAGFLSAAIGLGVALPSAPGATGVFHSVARYALEIPFAFPRDTAVAIGFASHAFMYMMMCGLGLVGLATQGLSWGLLRSSLSRQSAEE